MGNNAYKKRHKELGLCVDCSEPAYPDMNRCLKHYRIHRKGNLRRYYKNSEKERQRARKKRILRKAEGRCTKCTAPLDPDADKGRVNCCNCNEGIYNERLILGNTIV